MRPCKVSDIVLDTGCHLTGQICGVNMVFKTISQGISYPSISRYCDQRCSCKSEEFIAKTFHCERKEEMSDMMWNDIFQVISAPI